MLTCPLHISDRVFIILSDRVFIAVITTAPLHLSGRVFSILSDCVFIVLLGGSGSSVHTPAHNIAHTTVITTGPASPRVDSSASVDADSHDDGHIS